MRGDQVSAQTLREAVLMDWEMQAHIGRKLQEIYHDIAREAVPDCFLELLAKLERREAVEP